MCRSRRAARRLGWGRKVRLPTTFNLARRVRRDVVSEAGHAAHVIRIARGMAMRDAVLGCAALRAGGLPACAKVGHSKHVAAPLEEEGGQRDDQEPGAPHAGPWVRAGSHRNASSAAKWALTGLKYAVASTAPQSMQDRSESASSGQLIISTPTRG